MNKTVSSPPGLAFAYFTTLCVLACLWAGPAHAGSLRTEVFELSRAALPVAALIKPLLSEGSVASALGHTLVIRARPETLAEVKLLIDRLDAPVRTLRVSVRHGRERAHQATGTSVWSSRAGRAHSRVPALGGFGVGDTSPRKPDANANVRVYSTHSRASSNDFSSVQVLDGGEAFVSTGKDLPVQTSAMVSDGDVRVAGESIAYRKVATGFFVRPRLVASDAEVLMQIAPSWAVLESSPARAPRMPVIRQQSVVTTVRGPVGEWLALAANGRARAAPGNALVHSSQHLREAITQVFVKVEIVP